MINHLLEIIKIMKGITMTNQITTNQKAQFAKLAKLDREIKELQSQISKQRAKCLEILEKANLNEYENTTAKFTKTSESKRITVDSKKLKEDYLEIFNQYSKETTVKATLRIIEK